MPYPPTIHIEFDPFYSNRIVDFKVRFLKIASKFKKFITVLHIHTGLVISLNKDLSKLFIMIEGLKVVTSTLDYDAAVIEYPVIKKSLERFKGIYYILDNIKFLGSSQTKNIAENILLDLYEIESKIRYKVFENTPAPDTDKGLIDSATNISLNTLYSINAG